MSASGTVRGQREQVGLLRGMNMTSERPRGFGGLEHTTRMPGSRGGQVHMITVTAVGVRSAYTSIRSHKHQSGSKAESIWMRFSKGQNRKDSAGSVYCSLLRQSEALASAFLVKIFKIGTGRRCNRDGKGVLSRHVPHLMNRWLALLTVS